MGTAFSMLPGVRSDGSGVPTPPVLSGNTFAVRDDVNGILFYGSIPIDWMVPMLEIAKKRLHSRKAIIHTGISWTCGAMMAITTEQKAPAWMKSMGIGPDNPNWLLSCDCGTSSLTIYSVLGGYGNVLRGARPGVPCDADDFGRCYRLLKRYPEWRARLPEVAAAYPEWAPVVAAWDELGALFEAKDYGAVSKVLAREAAEQGEGRR